MNVLRVGSKIEERPFLSKIEKICSSGGLGRTENFFERCLFRQVGIFGCLSHGRSFSVFYGRNSDYVGFTVVKSGQDDWKPFDDFPVLIHSLSIGLDLEPAIAAFEIFRQQFPFGGKDGFSGAISNAV